MSRYCIIIMVLIMVSIGFAKDYDIRDFGAKGDGKTDNTQAIQRAIDTCSETGGKVIFPSGTFMTGMVRLKSDVTIELTKKAVWSAIADRSLYPFFMENRRYESNTAFIFAHDCNNISIIGEGLIDGNGEHEVFVTPRSQIHRPYGFYIWGCKNVNFTGIRCQHAAFWMIRVYECEDVIIRGLRIFNHANRNNDGIDIVDCHRVTVSDCIIDSSDDALCIKSESNMGTCDVVITNCIISSFASAIKCGTAAYTGFKRICISNCVIKRSLAKEMHHPYELWRGIAGIDLNNVDGGIMEDITINNIVIDGVNTPLFIKLGERMRIWQHECLKDADKRTPGIVRNISLSNITTRNGGRAASSITGYPGHYVENIRLSHIDLFLEGSGTEDDMTMDVPENSKGYPVSLMFNKSNLPAYGLYLRHVKNITLDHVTIRTEKNDPRYELVADDVHGFYLTNFKSNHPAREKASMKIVNSSNIQEK